MIQVCSQCGTRWNVRDRQRSWCPRCGGTLLAPSAPQWSPQQGGAPLPPPPSAPAPQAPPRPSQQPARPPTGRPPQAGTPRLAPGYRWVALRPGAPPRRRIRRGPLGPTPRYPVIPRWGLQQQFDVAAEEDGREREAPAPATVRTMLVVTMVALGVAAFAHVLRYGLMLINRSVLLHPLIADAAVAFGVVASLVALVILVITAVILIKWLIARRAEAYAERGQPDPRSAAEMWLMSLIPGVNVLFTPVYVLELATLEARLSRLRRPVVVWWIIWALSAIVAVWSVVSTVVVTFFANTTQHLADNNVTVAIGYLLALATVLLVSRVYLGFEGTPAERHSHRWVVVEAESGRPAQPADSEDEPDSAVPVESQGQNPAALAV
ncbi:hypothetical protein A5784_29470 [Mycobacterium sp. 852013-50091_SCH5140682]|uniref:DUF4328 domain-containing protein n=1 Tax=Mycobacterium sp. 852013-50091_SCH5140682 TaxID=1834109 RepID=UPI0007EAC79A|nr:DUF4328 domain-containing protein [Mycobacterium sp. 852013-50091_SCH5140682]OBC14741.1 hypothetical protein A5784_29470 [Mycobacterium sp. 852013-50091_SCH5140682]